MPGERSPYERETLIFSNPEAAKSWQEKAAVRLEQAKSDQVDRRREEMGDLVAEQFSQAGVSVNLIKEPWTHTTAEHEEAQKLVDVAFAQDLPTALKMAQQSAHYPRNLDLFHDVLTGEMYDLMRESGIGKQPLAGWALLMFAVVCVAILLWLVLSTF